MKNYTRHLISDSASIREGLIKINQNSGGILCLFVVDDAQRLVGTLTDGDIRRALISGIGIDETTRSAMNKNFIKIQINEITPAKIKKCRVDDIKLLPCVDADGKICKVYNLVEKQSVLPIDAVLMAGGKGERLLPLTEKTPKPLLKVGNKAIIDYNIERLLHFGVEHIHITVNYLAEQIESHFAVARDDVKISCIREPNYYGTMGSVKFITNFHNDTVLIMNSDLFTNIDLEEFYDHFSKHSADLSVAAVPYSVSIPYGILKLEDRYIRGLQEKPTYNYYANGGIYLVKKKLLDLIPMGTFFDATEFVELLIAQGYKVVRFPLIGYWIDIGKPADYHKVQEFIKHIKS